MIKGLSSSSSSSCFALLTTYVRESVDTAIISLLVGVFTLRCFPSSFACPVLFYPFLRNGEGDIDDDDYDDGGNDGDDNDDDAHDFVDDNAATNDVGTPQWM